MEKGGYGSTLSSCFCWSYLINLNKLNKFCWYRIMCGTYLIIFFKVLGWRKLMFIKYYRKINDVDTWDPFNHPIWVALLWMVLDFMKWICRMLIKNTLCLLWELCFFFGSGLNQVYRILSIASLPLWWFFIV